MYLVLVDLIRQYLSILFQDWIVWLYKLYFSWTTYRVDKSYTTNGTSWKKNIQCSPNIGKVFFLFRLSVLSVFSLIVHYHWVIQSLHDWPTAMLYIKYNRTVFVDGVHNCPYIGTGKSLIILLKSWVNF